MTDRRRYIAVILSESSSDAPGYRRFLEESFLLLEATSLEDAQAQATVHAGEPHEYQNQYGDTISWHREVVAVGEALTDRFESGAELYARFFRNREAYDQLGFEDFYRS